MQKKPEEFALEYAGFWVRLGANIIDIAIIAAFFYIVYLIILEFTNTTIFWILSYFATGCIVWFLVIVYVVGFWAWRGQTPGKMITGIKIIRTDSSPLTLSYSLYRFVGYIVCILTLCIGFIWIAFDKRKQGLHDKIADTYVVKLPVRQVVLTESLAGGEIG
ncbi:MAG: RDD family protein [Dehalococcoidia bacterium]